MERKTTKKAAPKRTVKRRRTSSSGKPKAADKQRMIKEAESIISEVALLRAEGADIADQVKVKQSEVLTLLKRAGINSHKFIDSDGHSLSTTVVQGTKIALDEEKLRKKVGAALWNKITTRVLDRKKLEAFVASGEVSQTVLAQCSDETPNTPYIKITVK